MILSRRDAKDAEWTGYSETLRPLRLCVIQNGLAHG
jgi:hypothetical protein